jgi:hypothetical protein
MSKPTASFAVQLKLTICVPSMERWRAGVCLQCSGHEHERSQIHQVEELAPS